MILEWICPADKVNPSQDQAAYLERRKAENTAVWIFDHPLYKEWRTSSLPFLWISGKSKCIARHPPSDADTNQSGGGKICFDVLMGNIKEADYS